MESWKMYSKKVKNDQFYTSPTVAEKCIDVLKKYKNGLIMVEPSAGSGSFSSLVNCIAYDLEPKEKSIISADFFEVELPEEPFCLFGNPPFGINNKLSKGFLKRGFTDLNCKCIGFILPTVFDKTTTQKIIPDSWNLMEVYDIGSDAFIVDGSPYHIPCKFYVFGRIGHFPDSLDFRTKDIDVNITDFSLVSKNDESDLFVFGASARKIIPSSEVNSNNRGYFLKSHIDITALCAKIREVPWEKSGKSSVNGGVFWLTKNEFKQAYFNYWSGKNDTE